MRNDWREPFLELKEELRLLYKASGAFYHGVLLSTNRSREELQPSIDWLEPAIAGHRLLREVRLETTGCIHHSHVFFGSSGASGFLRLEQLLHGIEEWLGRVPPGTLPGFDVPPVGTQGNRNLLRWAAIVYYVAERADAPYLEFDVEFQMDLDDLYFATWHHCPQPPNCRPLDWLICRSSVRNQIPQMKAIFATRDEQFPDLIDAYLPADFITSSMAAIDLLTAVLHLQEKNRPAATDSGDYVQRLKEAKLTKENRQSLQRLIAILLYQHNPEANTTPNLDVKKALTADSIAELMGFKGHPRAVRSEAQRLMEILFGASPMMNYRRVLRKATVKGGERGEGASLLYEYFRHRKIPALSQ